MLMAMFNKHKIYYARQSFHANKISTFEIIPNQNLSDVGVASVLSNLYTFYLIAKIFVRKVLSA